jgi:peptide/nickel transport system permease protein
VLRFVLARTGWLLLTLWLVSIMVFALGQVLPGDAARVALGPLADARAVAALQHQLGTDRPVVVKYLSWAAHILRGDLGTSLTFRAPVTGFLGAALAQSFALAGIALALVVPLGIGAGVWAGLRAGSLLDRAIMLTSLSAAIVPDFVSALVLILIFGLALHWFPVTGTPPPDAGFFNAIYYRLLPALPLVLVLVGYIARMARTGTVEALRADYTRTAILKGLLPHVVVLRHVLPNALMPTITVLTTQLGYLIGGLVAIESLFRIHGLGNLVYGAARARDLPMLEGGVLVMAAVYSVGAALGDILHGLIDPRLRRRAGTWRRCRHRPGDTPAATGEPAGWRHDPADLGRVRRRARAGAA